MRTVQFSQAVLEPWAILPEKLTAIMEVVTRHFTGEKLDAAEVQARIHGGPRPAERAVGSATKVAVLPLFGTIFPRANLFTETSGATSAEIFGKRFDALVEDPTVGAIVLDIDSPGGQVPGVEELSTKIYNARGKKPIVAVANYLMASAAYWIGTAADELVVTPSAEVGSIGVFTMHEDISEQLAREGIRVTLISEGKYKVEGNPYEPLEEEARAALQARVAEVYDRFVATVARNRGVSEDQVRNGFGEGRLVSAADAVERGMADRIATLEEVIERLISPASAVETTGAAVDTPDLLIEEDSGTVAAGDAAEPDQAAEIERLRRYVEIFGPKKGGE